MKTKLFSARELMARWGTQEELVIIEAIKNGLSCYYKNKYNWEVEAVGQNDLKNFNLDAAFNKFVFYRSDVEKYEADRPEMKDGDSGDVPNLTANAMLKQPVFIETMAMAKKIFAYCEKNRSVPVKKDDAYKIFCKKQGILSVQIFREIWKIIPTSIRRKRGHQDP